MGKVNFWERTSINVVSNLARTVIMALVGVFLIPYYIDNLGTSVYAIIPLATTISSYVLVLSDALVSAGGRYLRVAMGESKEKANTAFSTEFMGLLKTCSVLLIPCIIISVLSPEIFSIPEEKQIDVQVMFALVLLSSLIVSFSSVFNGIFFAHNMMYKVYFSRLLQTTFQLLIVVVLFNVSSPSLIDIGCAYIFSSIFLLTCLVLLLKTTPYVPKINFKLYDKSLFKEMGILGVWSIISKLGSLLYIELSIVLVNIYLGTECQAGFAILSTIVSMVGTATISLSSSIEPLLYRMYAEKHEDSLRRTVCVGKKVLGLMMAMPIAFLIVFGDNILTTWIGSEFTYLVDFLWIILAASMMRCCALSSSAIPVLYLRVHTMVVNTITFGVLNCLITIFVLQFTNLGLDGAVYVWALCYFFEEVGYVTICGHITHATAGEVYLPILLSYSVCLITGILFFGLSQIIDIGTTWFTIIPIFLTLFFVYAIIILRAVLPSKDVELIKHILPGPFKRLLGKSKSASQ